MPATPHPRQASEGWDAYWRTFAAALARRHMERPALKRLLADVKARKVDCVVVYKVDRLTRSLFDFSRIVEVLDNHGVSFVAVTQQFNTTTSLGRLTLNILLSFAQFEREIIPSPRDNQVVARKQGSGRAATSRSVTIWKRQHGGFSEELIGAANLRG